MSSENDWRTIAVVMPETAGGKKFYKITDQNIPVSDVPSQPPRPPTKRTYSTEGAVSILKLLVSPSKVQIMSGKSKRTGGKKSPLQPELSDPWDWDEESAEEENFEMKIARHLSGLSKALLGDKQARKMGLIQRVDNVEGVLHGVKSKEDGLVTKVKNLEEKVRTAGPSGSASMESATSLQKKISRLEESNKVLMGFASRLQKSNKSLQNQIYVQHDKLNYLNLHLGGVAEIADTTCREQAVEFFS